MSGAATLTAARVRAYRILTSGLAREHGSWQQVPVWRLGLQDRDGSARLALAARLPESAALPAFDEPGGHDWPVMAWSLRGSPHLHPRTDLPRFAAALWPADETDAAARLLGDTKRLGAAGAGPLEAYRVVAGAFRERVTEPTVKGAASAAITAAVPERFSGLCVPCGSVHVREMLFRLTALPGSIGLEPDTRPVQLAPLSNPFETPSEQSGLDVVVADYYRAYGVATASDVGTHVGTSASAVRPALPDDLVPVTVDGARSQAPAAVLDAVREADEAAAGSVVRLLPPFDPLLQPRDRAVITTDQAERKALWPAIGQPGSVLARGGIVGSWRTRAAGSVLTITVTGFGAIPRPVRTELEREAERVGAVRGAARTRLVIDA